MDIVAREGKIILFICPLIAAILVIYVHPQVAALPAVSAIKPVAIYSRLLG